MPQATLPGPLAEAPDVGMLPDCPSTIWNSGFEDVVGERDGGVATTELPSCPLEISATDYFGASEGPNKDAASIAAKKDEVTIAEPAAATAVAAVAAAPPRGHSTGTITTNNSITVAAVAAATTASPPHRSPLKTLPPSDHGEAA